MTGSTAPLSPGAALRLLADRHRRSVLEYLANNGEEPVPLHALASQISGGKPAANEGQPAAYDSVVTSLFHTHLPKLHEAGLIEYDRHGSVRYRAQENVEGLLDYVTASFG